MKFKSATPAVWVLLMLSLGRQEEQSCHSWVVVVVCEVGALWDVHGELREAAGKGKPPEKPHDPVPFQWLYQPLALNPCLLVPFPSIVVWI